MRKAKRIASISQSVTLSNRLFVKAVEIVEVVETVEIVKVVN